MQFLLATVTEKDKKTLINMYWKLTTMGSEHKEGMARFDNQQISDVIISSKSWTSRPINSSKQQKWDKIIQELKENN